MGRRARGAMLPEGRWKRDQGQHMDLKRGVSNGAQRIRMAWRSLESVAQAGVRVEVGVEVGVKVPGEGEGLARRALLRMATTGPGEESALRMATTIPANRR